MFWRIPDFAASSPVELMLDREDFTLQELLDEEDIVQECRGFNSRLINFLRVKAQVEQLLRYIVEGSPEDDGRRETFKFPFIACEILTCEVDVILKTLVEDDELMDMLFSFLAPSHAHNTILAGYFSKVVICLMLRKTTSLMKYVQTHEHIVHQLIELIDITSVMEILVQLIGMDDDVMKWLADSYLLEMIVDKLSPSSSPEIHANAAEVLCAIIRNAPSALAAKMTRRSYVSRIFSHSLGYSISKSAFVYSLSVCICLLDPKRSASTPFIHSFRSQHLYEPCILVDPETISAMLPELGHLLTILDIPSDVNVLPTTFGELRPPLGKHRLKVVEFIAVLLETGDEAAENELISSGVIQRILNLFLEYPFNNFLHHHVESIILSCLDSKNIAIIDHLFNDCNIIVKLLQADNTPILSDDSALLTLLAAGRQSLRVGYIGHITQIANKLVEMGSHNDQIQIYLQENAEWIDWQHNILHERNTLENVYRWDCGRPTAMQDTTRDSDEDELHDRDYDVSQSYRCSVYENEVAVQDVYFDDESAEVVVSSLKLGNDNESGSSLFANSNWFTFQEDRTNEELQSTSALDGMQDICLNGTVSGGNERDQVVVGEDDELAVTLTPNGSSGTASDLMNITTVNGSVNQQATNSEEASTTDGMRLFHLETSWNADLFNNQQLPDWVGWREPSDIDVDLSTDLSTPPDPIDPGVSSHPHSVTYEVNNRLVSPVESGRLQNGAISPSLFEDAEFVSANLEGMGREGERRVCISREVDTMC